jgi:hypothetical protein
VPGWLSSISSCTLLKVPFEPICRGNSLLRKRTPLGPYRRPMPRVLGGSSGGRHPLMGEIPLYSQRPRRCSTTRRAATECEAPRGAGAVATDTRIYRPNFVFKNVRSCHSSKRWSFKSHSVCMYVSRASPPPVCCGSPSFLFPWLK